MCIVNCREWHPKSPLCLSTLHEPQKQWRPLGCEENTVSFTNAPWNLPICLLALPELAPFISGTVLSETSVRAESYGCDSLRVGCGGSEGVKRVLGRKTKCCSQLECIGIWARYIFYHKALSSVPNTPETAFLACATTCQQCLSGFVTTGRHAVTLPKLPLVPGLWLRASRPWLMSPTSPRVISYSLCIYSQEHRKNMTFLP